MEAVKLLDAAGELDSHLKPISRGDDSDGDQEEGGEPAGAEPARGNMERRAGHYPNIVSHQHFPLPSDT